MFVWSKFNYLCVGKSHQLYKIIIIIIKGYTQNIKDKINKPRKELDRLQFLSDFNCSIQLLFWEKRKI